MAALILTGFPLGSTSVPGSVDAAFRGCVNQVVAGTDSFGNYAEYVYLKGVASTIVGSVVVYDHTGLSALLTVNGGAAGVGPVAVALAICDSAVKGAWYGIYGTFATDVVANTAAAAKLGRETTDGKVGDGFVGGDQIVGAISRVATTAAAIAFCSFYRGFVGVNVA